MIRAEAFLVPSIRVTTIAAATNMSFKPHPMTRVVRLLKALVANDAGGVLLTIFAFPSYIARLHYFSADAH